MYFSLKSFLACHINLFCCGDDTTDEYMFSALPENSISIKIGEKNTSARYYVRSTLELKSILSNFIKSDK